MWRWVVSVVLFIHIALPQPLTDGETATQPRQYDFGECCPCPDSNVDASFRSQSHWLNPTGNSGRSFLEQSRNPGQFSNGYGFSRSGFDDCPCRFRGADSEGSSSIFFPAALRPTGSLSKPLDSKEDPKNLLEPEVGLASSVLETLREVTDEEYRDALARDAARARATEDATPEESAQNMVTIILPSAGDEEDFVPVASHIQEPRCIHPLGSSLSRMRMPLTKSPNVLTEIFRMPKPKHVVGLLHKDTLDLDNGLGASNVQERIVDLDGRNRKIKTTPAILKHEISDVCEVDFKKGSRLKSAALLEKENALPQQSNVIKSSNIPKTITNTRNEDMKSSASDINRIFSDKVHPGLKLDPLMSQNSPINFKNLLKLRDVELISPGQLIEKLKLGQPALQLPTLIENIPKLSDLLKNGIKFDLNKNSNWNNAKNGDKSIEVDKTNTNIQVIPRDKTTINVLDVLPSNSNINEVIDSCDIAQKTGNNLPESLSEVKAMKSETINSDTNSFHSTENNDHDISDNELGQEAKNDEDNDCESVESKNEAIASDEKISSQGQDLLNPTIKSDENLQPNSIQNDASVQDFGASNCLETIHDDQVNSEIEEILPRNDHVSDIDVKTRTSTEENARSRHENSWNTVNSINKLSKITTNHNNSPLSKSLSAARQSILQKIEDRKKISKLFDDVKLRELNVESPDVENSNQDCHKEPSNNVPLVLLKPIDIEDNTIKSSKVSNTMRLEDLQKLSDSLLEQSLIKEKSASVIEHTDCDNDNNMKMNSPTGREYELINTGPMSDIDTESNNRHVLEMKNPQNFDSVPENIENSDHIDNQEDPPSECVNNIITKDSSKFLGIGPDVNEMAVAASEPVMGTQWQDPLSLFKNTFQDSPLFQNIVVQPSSLFERISNPENLGLGKALNLPTLDDVRERLANIFGRNDKGSTVDAIDCPNENPSMSAEPSISNFISRSPTTPLEDLNLNIFQLKPLTAGKSSTLSKIPSLNLKSFKTKVPIPNNLDLKPLKLQSTVGNEGGLLGATLTLGRDTGGTPKIFESLGNPLQHLPGLDDVMGRSFVSNPLDLSRTIDSIPRISDLSDNLRSNTENTIRALQQRMDSTLGQASHLLSGSPKRPQELIERIAEAKDDLDAKLKGLHYDLNDRLTSIHENILDRTGIVTMNPLFQGGELSGRNFYNKNQNLGVGRIPTSTSNKNKLEHKKKILSKTTNYKNRTPVGRKVESISSTRKFKMPASASVPVPKTIEVPKFKSSLDKSLSTGNNLKDRFGSTRTQPLRLIHKLDALPKQSSKPFPDKSISGKQASSFKDKKIKVTFGSTTPSPISPIKSQQRSNSNVNRAPIKEFTRPDNGLRRRLNLQSRNDPHGSPSEVQPTRILSPSVTETRTCNENMNSLEDSRESRPRNPDTKENRGNTNREDLKGHNNLKSTKNFESSKSESRGNNKNPILPLPSWPKVDEKSFLSKIRDAVKARLASFDPKKSISESKAKTFSDMERSASENNAIVVGDNLKENVSYKCRMVCTKS